MAALQRILIADDNRDLADSLAMVLEFLGHETRVAYDGKQAVDICRDFAPALVIMDINMPVMDGYEAASVIRKDSDRQVLLVACTGAAGWESKHKALEHGFDMHFSKPLDPAALQDLLQKAPLERRQSA